jgi:hypothetical protein
MGWCGCAVPREGDRVAADPPPDHAIRGSVSFPGSTASTSNMRGDLVSVAVANKTARIAWALLVRIGRLSGSGAYRCMSDRLQTPRGWKSDSAREE